MNTESSQEIAPENRGRKRPRPDSDDEDMAMESRSPSPDLITAGSSSAAVSVDKHIQSSNRGFGLLQKMGWSPGQGLGLAEHARLEPVAFDIHAERIGVGKSSEDLYWSSISASHRRSLNSERQSKETDEERLAREEQVAKQSFIQSEVSTMLRSFYCSVCDKQFKSSPQYDEHTNSISHAHMARRGVSSFKVLPSVESDARKEKERRRDEKELQKIAAASGVKIKKSHLLPVVAPPPEIQQRGMITERAERGWGRASFVPVDTEAPLIPRSATPPHGMQVD